jgi:hypothetical protein
MTAPEHALETFELEIWGGSSERRYRRMRPEVEAMPWGTLNPGQHTEADLVMARQAWTGAAFQEHRTGVACAMTLRALMQARAPLDLVALATRFPLDEVVHVELCSRMAMELGGGTELLHDSRNMVKDANPEASPLMQAVELSVRYFCVGEALSIPLLHGTWMAASHPLSRAVLGRIVRDEAAHGMFGWTVLDWAEPDLTTEDRATLGRVAGETLHTIVDNWRRIASQPAVTDRVNALGWMRSGPYLALARRSLQQRVLKPLLDRGIEVPLPDDPLVRA